jgi:hypothetical protein
MKPTNGWPNLRALLLLVPLVAVAAVLVAGSGDAGARTAALPALFGTVGPGYTITLKNPDGTLVRRIPAGKYVVHVNDRGKIHDFHLWGPNGTNVTTDKKTTVPFVGKVSWTVDFTPGTYHYLCDPHFLGMAATFQVVKAH